MGPTLNHSRKLQPARAAAPVTVRETSWGFVIRSEAPASDLEVLAGRALRVLRAACWLSVGGVAMMPASRSFAMGFTPKLVACGTILAAAYLGASLLARRSGHEFQVDTAHRLVRTAAVAEDGTSRVTGTAEFEQIADLILRRRLDTDERSLCIRLRDADELLAVAQGGEAALRELHDRLQAAFNPYDDRLYELAQRGLRVEPRAAAIFPKLGPNEVAL